MPQEEIEEDEEQQEEEGEEEVEPTEEVLPTEEQLPAVNATRGRRFVYLGGQGRCSAV